MDRKQFTFYDSFYKAISRIKNKTARCDAYDAICKYALTGVYPDLDKLPDGAAIAFVSAQANIDASRRKAESGRAGGRSKQNASKSEAERKQEESASDTEVKTKQDKEQDKEQDKDKDKDKEQMLYPPISPTDAQNANSDISRVMEHYMNNINPLPNSIVLENLKNYLAGGMNADVIIRAIDKAVAENVRKQSYINGILKDWQNRGIKTIAQVAAADEEFNRRKQAEKQKNGSKYAPIASLHKQNYPTADDLQKSKMLLEKIKEAQ